MHVSFIIIICRSACPLVECTRGLIGYKMMKPSPGYVMQFRRTVNESCIVVIYHIMSISQRPHQHLIYSESRNCQCKHVFCADRKRFIQQEWGCKGNRKMGSTSVIDGNILIMPENDARFPAESFLIKIWTRRNDYMAMIINNNNNNSPVQQEKKNNIIYWILHK